MTRARRNTLLLVLLALALAASIFVVVLPQIILHRQASRLLQATGLVLPLDTKTGFSFSEGFAVTLSDVALASSNQQGVPVVSVAEIIMPLHFSDFLPGAAGPHESILEDASFAFPVTNTTERNRVAQPDPLRLTLRNSVLKLDDPKRGTVFAASDINGEIVIDGTGALLIDVRALLNGQPTQVTASFDDIVRLQGNGSPADFALATKDQSLIFSGRAQAIPTPTLDGTFSLQSPDAASALAWLGFGAFGVLNGSALRVEGPVSLQGLRVELPKSLFSLGGSKGEMKLALDAGRDRPKLLARSVVDKLVLALPAIIAQSGNWSDVPFDLSQLRSFDADTEVTAVAALAGNVTMGPSTFAVKLNDGTAELKLNGEDVGGATLISSLAMTVTGTEPVLRLDFSLNNANATRLASQVFNFADLTGDTDLTLKLDATGASPARLVSSLKGDANMLLRKGTLSGFDLTGLAKASETAQRDGWHQAAATSTDMSEVLLETKLDEGIARIVKGEIKGQAPALSFSGEIDVLRQALAVKLANGVTVAGPWANPHLAPPP